MKVGFMTKMAALPYIGFVPGDNSFVNSPELQDYLDKREYLKVLTFLDEECTYDLDEEEAYDEKLVEVSLPTVTSESVYIFDSRVRPVDSVRLERDLDDLLPITHEDDGYCKLTEEYLDVLFLMYKAKAAKPEELFPTLDESDQASYLRELFGSRLDN